MMTVEKTIALRIIARLNHADTPRRWPSLLYREKIYSQHELRSWSDDELRAHFPYERVAGYTAELFAWGYRFAHVRYVEANPGNVLFLFPIPRHEPRPDYPLLLFWPPPTPGAPPELVWSLCDQEATLTGCYWLTQQVLTPDSGPRVPVYARVNSDYDAFYDIDAQHKLEPVALNFWEAARDG